MFTKKTVLDIDVAGKTILVRAMLNVPIENGMVGDKMRLLAAKPTLDYLLEHGAKLILISHHSREGQSLAPVAPAMSEVLGRPVKFLSDSVGSEVEQAVMAQKPGDVLMLENLRFHPEEEANDPGFAAKLAAYAQIFVDDDFTTAHREHASIIGIPKLIPAVAGLQVEKEVDTITGAIEDPKRPLVAVTGGAKISTKIPIILTLLPKVDALFVGGAMANTFLLAKGYEVGKSLVEADQVETAKKVMATAEAAGKTIVFPVDVVVTTDLKSETNIRTVKSDSVSANDIIADIGPESVAKLASLISPSGSVIWNGPVGIAEQKAFSEGTRGVAETIINSGATSLIGGGDTADFVDGANLADKFTFVSTGGGASLELLSGNKLPGVEALQDKE